LAEIVEPAVDARQAPAQEGVRTTSTESEPVEVVDEPVAAHSVSRWWLAAGGVALVALMAFLVILSGGDNGEASRRGASPAAAAAEQGAPPSGVTAQTAAEVVPPPPDPRLIEAQHAAERAAMMVDILAAPDLMRYALAGGPAAPTAYAQVLWSRTRGLAVTASRLAPPAQDMTYHVWIASATSTESAGVLVPDATGRASLVVPGPLTLPRLGAIRVTLEPAGASAPSGAVCLTGGPA
jgi:hypothetical protein